MLKDLKPLIEKAMDFCKDNTEMILICGAAVIGLILIISIIKTFTKKDAEEDLDFDEDDFIRALAQRSENSKGTPASCGQLEETIEAEETSAADQEEKVEALKPNVIFPEELIDELSKFSSSSLKEVEIKIQSAELKLKYAGAGGEAFSREEVKIFGDKPSTDQVEDNADDEEPVSDEETRPCKDVQPELNLDEIKNLEGETHLKFGVNNFNISKSGKVFTEEELEKQIRD